MRKFVTVGRPKLYGDENPLESYTVRLSGRQANTARRIGQGNLAEGIRRSIEHYEESKPVKPQHE